MARAGLGERYGGRTVSPKLKRHAARTMSDDEIIAELQRVAAVLNTTTLTRAEVVRHSRTLGARVFLSRFGSFHAALAAGALEHSPLANRWTDQEYIDNLRVVWEHLGRRPIRWDVSRPPSRITGEAYRNRFGSWENALAAAERGP